MTFEKPPCRIPAAGHLRMANDDAAFDPRSGARSRTYADGNRVGRRLGVRYDPATQNPAPAAANHNMSLEQWTEVDRYVTNLLARQDAVLDAALEASATAGLPGIQVSAPQGKLLMLLAMAQGARNILELGTLGGYSSIWLARALPPGGRLVTLEADPKHAEVARANFTRAGSRRSHRVTRGAGAGHAADACGWRGAGRLT